MNENNLRGNIIDGLFKVKVFFDPLDIIPLPKVDPIPIHYQTYQNLKFYLKMLKNYLSQKNLKKYLNHLL